MASEKMRERLVSLWYIAAGGEYRQSNVSLPIIPFSLFCDRHAQFDSPYWSHPLLPFQSSPILYAKESY